MVTPKKPDNLNNAKIVDSKSCSVCRDLLANLERFYTMINAAHTSSASDWLTVDEVAKELKISKSIVYRLIHHGEIEAVNIVDSNGEIPKKGHYRIKRSSLNKHLESKKVRPFPNASTRTSRPRRFRKVKNHLGL